MRYGTNDDNDQVETEKHIQRFSQSNDDVVHDLLSDLTPAVL